MFHCKQIWGCVKEMELGMTRQSLSARSVLKIRDEIRRTDSQHFICLSHVVESISSILRLFWTDKKDSCSVELG